MKIVIISLEPKQAKLIYKQYPGLDLTIVTADSERMAAAMAKRADVIVVTTKFISHALFGSLERHKVYYCNGGLTELRKYLNGLQALYNAQIPETVRPSKEATLVVKSKTIAPPSYAALKTAKAGDVLVFKRPPQETIIAFETKVRYNCEYYKRAHGVHSERNSIDGAVEVMVTKAADVKPSRRATLPRLSSLPKKEKHAIQTAFDAAYTPVAQHAPHDSITRMFWRDVYLQTMRNNPGADLVTIAAHANIACDLYHTRFKESP